VQSGILTSPATRVVSPTSNTSYVLERVDDNSCFVEPDLTANVLIGDVAPLVLEPDAVAQGLGPLSFLAAVPCDVDVEQLRWLHDGQPIGQDVNPFQHSFIQPGVQQLEVEMTETGSGTMTSAFATVLVPHHPQSNLDPSGDTCQSLADLRLMLDRWLSSASNDPDDNGLWQVLDYLFINTGEGYPPCP